MATRQALVVTVQELVDRLDDAVAAVERIAVALDSIAAALRRMAIAYEHELELDDDEGASS